MAVSISPKPSDGPIPASSGSVPFQITTSIGAFLNAFVVLRDGTVIKIEKAFLAVGVNKLRLFLPAGSPPGSRLTLSVYEMGSGKLSTYHYGLV